VIAHLALCLHASTNGGPHIRYVHVFFPKILKSTLRLSTSSPRQFDTPQYNMAFQVIIDLKNIGEQIVTAIRSSIEGVSTELVANTANLVKQEPQALDIRAQILGQICNAAS